MQISSIYSICPRSSYTFYIVTKYTKLVTTSWTHSNMFPDKEQVTFIFFIQNYKYISFFKEQFYHFIFHNNEIKYWLTYEIGHN